MSKLVITRGLPGSGKTTYAKRWVSEYTSGRARLNRDDLREMLHGGPHGYVPQLEKAVTFAHQGAVRALLLAGRDVICDDMNLQNRQVKEWMKLAAEAGADFEVVDFTNVPRETCIERDYKRSLAGGRRVGADYIHKKHQQFIKGKPYPLPMPELPAGQYVEPYVPPQNKPKAILVDIDGTVALMGDRGPYDWHRVGEDEPNEKVIEIIKTLLDYHDEYGAMHFIFLSGRDEVCRDQTLAWLHKHVNYGSYWGTELYMRSEGDNRKDSIVKFELFNRYVRHNYDVRAVFDDRDQVVKMWRDLGLTCLQVAPGAF